MDIIVRIRKIIAANINTLFEKAKDPESLLKELIREMDENIVIVKNEIVKSLALEKSLTRQIKKVKNKIQTLHERSKKAIQENNDELARKALENKLQQEKKLPDLTRQLNRAIEFSATLKDHRRLLENKIHEVYRKMETLVARRQNALAKQAVQSATKAFSAAARKSNKLLSKTGLPSGSLKEKVLDIESEIEAMEEILNQNTSVDDFFEQSEQSDMDEEIERELQDLKKKYKKETKNSS